LPRQRLGREKITVAPVDLEMLRYERVCRKAHLMPAHLRTEAHVVYRQMVFPGRRFEGQEDFTYEDNESAIEDGNRSCAEPQTPPPTYLG